jgi:hypothetical protein
MLAAMPGSEPEADPGADVAAATSPTLDELVLADPPERWAALGFAVTGDVLQLGCVRVRLAGADAGQGIVGWSLRGLAGGDLDGLATDRAQSSPPGPAPPHPNGIVAIDHVVAMTPDLDRSVRALQGAGLDLRRIREEPTPAGAPRQAFFRLGAEILEVVQEPEHLVAEQGGSQRPTRLWGLALLTADIDASATALAPHAGDVREAVQPGRRIATLKRSAGLAVPVALMSPRS